MRDRFIRAAILAGVAALGLLAPAPGSAKDPASLRLWISLRHPGVGWVTTGELAASLEGADAPAPLLLDARSPDEFVVSRIPGAARVDPEDRQPAPPGISPDRRIVVYCAVGYRSAAIARRLRKQGYSDVRNLEGGIFKWANEGRPMLDAQDATVRVVHPYARKWERYLDEPLRSYDGRAPAE
jgi:rhodanese-related sulfurtransferase